MRLTTIIIVVAALAVSVLTAFLIQWYLGSRTPTAEIKKEVVPAERILVAKTDITGGTVLKAKEHFRWQAWPTEGVRKDFVIKGTDVEKEFIGAIVRRNVKAGIPLTSSLIYRKGEMGFLAAGLKPGMRAVSVGISSAVGAGGFVTPGDRVDIILSTTLSIQGGDMRRQIRNGGDARKVSETIMRNVRVLAINRNAESAGKQAKRPKTATLEVTPKQAEILANARRMGKLFFALRPHVPAPELEPEPKFHFTTDLEILSALRGGLAARVDEINRNAVSEFGLDRWIMEEPANTSTAAQEPAPSPVSQPEPAKVMKKAAPRPLPRPNLQYQPAEPETAKATAKVQPAPDPQPLPKPKLMEPAKKVEAKSDPKPQVKAKTTAKSEPAKPAPETAKKDEKPTPPPKITVRIDRGGKVQVLRFKGKQAAQ